MNVVNIIKCDICGAKTNIKTQLELEDAGSHQRKTLNDKMSAGIKELENLQHNLVRAISPDAMYSSLQHGRFYQQFVLYCKIAWFIMC